MSNTNSSNTPAATATTSTTTTSTGSTVNVSSAHSAAGPGGIIFSERTIADSSWPTDLILDLSKTNWLEWSRRLSLLADRLYVFGYLNGTLSCPDVTTHAAAHHIWVGNDRSLRAFILEHISPKEYDIASPFGTACATFDGLRLRHEKLGLHAQINLLRKALDVYYEPGTPMLTTSKELRTLHDRITKMGKIDDDKLFTVLIINSLGRNYASLQSTIHGMTDEPNFSSSVALKRIETEASLELRRAELTAHTSSVALSASAPKVKRSDVVCSNCKRQYHTADFCVRPGGKMAGKTMEEAQAARRAASGKLPIDVATATTQVAKLAPSTANVAVIAPPTVAPLVLPPKLPTSGQMVNIEGIQYFLTPATPIVTTAPHSGNICVSAGKPIRLTDLNHFEAYITSCGEPDASLDWSEHSFPVDIANSSPLSPKPGTCPFILDSGATCHISPIRSDFSTLRSIAEHPITGLGGARVYAIGIGTVELTVDSGHRLLLNDVLFVPASTVRLISVVSLNREQRYFTIFGPDDCWLTDTNGAVVAHGTVSATRNLYTLSSDSPGNLPKLLGDQTALPILPYVSYVSTNTPDVETWHRRLAHCSVQTVLDMARNGVVRGMPIDLSTLPPKCDHCIVGKQTRSSVPKVREGPKATRRLERVFVDLCGPHLVTSKSGCRYSMNIIDDFSSYVWTIPLRGKDGASQALQVWHRLVENRSGEKLKILVTDNGELVSQSVADWCADSGIEHQLTAPYTSAQNGRAERLHRTLMNKTRTMRLACNAPTFLWDEFSLTAAYLTNLTASSSIGGKTPFELWYGHKPSLSHLREIGCRAYALITTNNPKILQRSVPCVLIGYAPLAKAYRLWNPASGRVFNSYHVSFIEHLDTTPTDFLPGTFLNVGDRTIPPTWDSLSFDSTKPSSKPAFPFITLPSTQLTLPAIDISTSSPPSILPPLSQTPPNPSAHAHPPPPRRSARIAALQEQAQALLAEFAPVRDTHFLIPTDLDSDDLTASQSLEEVLSAIADGSMEPFLDSGDDPSWADALASPDREFWITGGREEIKSLQDLKVFVLVPRSQIPQGHRPLKGKLVCKRKRDDSGNIVRYKVRYVAKGYAQRYGVDYDKTTAPTVRLESFRTILHIAASLG